MLRAMVGMFDSHRKQSAYTETILDGGLDAVDAGIIRRKWELGQSRKGGIPVRLGGRPQHAGLSR